MKILMLCFLLPVMVLGEGISLSLDNDVFAHTDRDYTHGTKITHMCDHAPSFLHKLSKDRSSNISYVLGQYMYTPEDITVEELIEGDRPYGGWLYMGYSFASYTPNKYDFFEIDLGVTGEWSQTDETQAYVHKVIDSKKPMGWDNQLEEEIGINLIWQEKWKFAPTKYVEVIPHYGVALGTIHTFANAGGLIRVGFNLPVDFGPVMMEPANREFSNWHAYIFTGVDGRFVNRNFFLDGNLFEDSHSVPKEYLFGDIRTGISLAICDFELIYVYTIRTKEHKLQDKHSEFGSLILSWKY